MPLINKRLIYLQGEKELHQIIKENKMINVLFTKLKKKCSKKILNF